MATKKEQLKKQVEMENVNESIMVLKYPIGKIDISAFGIDKNISFECYDLSNENEKLFSVSINGKDKNGDNIEFSFFTNEKPNLFWNGRLNESLEVE